MRYRNLQRVMLVVFALCIPGHPALAQVAPSAVDHPRFNELYQQALKNPTDRKTNLELAGFALSMQDYEAAISPMERILMQEPGNAKIKLQLGTLYQALGADLMAERYFTDAANTPNAPPAVVKEAKEMLHGQ